MVSVICQFSSSNIFSSSCSSGVPLVAHFAPGDSEYLRACLYGYPKACCSFQATAPKKNTSLASYSQVHLLGRPRILSHSVFFVEISFPEHHPSGDPVTSHQSCAECSYGSSSKHSDEGALQNPLSGFYNRDRPVHSDLR